MNIMKSNPLFILFIIFSIILTINSLIVIPFKVNYIKETRLNRDYNSSNFISDYFYRDFYANIITGIPSKEILALLDTRSHIFEFVDNFLDRESLYEIIDPEKKISKSTYDSTKSFSFRNISKFEYSNIEIKTASLCSETFFFYRDLSMETPTTIQELKFIINEGSGNDLHIRLGLNKPLTKEYQGPPHFIQSLLDVDAIKDQSWTIKFLSKNDGLFILGGEPHTYQDAEKDKRYQRQYYFTTNSLSGKEFHHPLSILAQKIYFKDNKGEGEDIIINENKGCYLDYNYGFIIGTKEYKEYILKNFFDELIKLKICSYDLLNFRDEYDVGYRYYSIRCDKFKFKLNDHKKQYYEKFPTLYIFIFDFNYNFELTKEDLFIEVNDKLYFMILFEKVLFDHPDLTYWHLGLPFLQKYEFVHNYEKQNIGFYIPYVEEEEEKEEKENEEKKEEKKEEKESNTSKQKKTEEIKNKDNSKINLIIIIVVIIIVDIILIIAVFCIAKKMYQKRKERANEMDDNYDYLSQDKEKK